MGERGRFSPASACRKRGADKWCAWDVATGTQIRVLQDQYDG